MEVRYKRVKAWLAMGLAMGLAIAMQLRSRTANGTSNRWSSPDMVTSEPSDQYSIRRSLHHLPDARPFGKPRWAMWQRHHPTPRVPAADSLAWNSNLLHCGTRC